MSSFESKSLVETNVGAVYILKVLGCWEERKLPKSKIWQSKHFCLNFVANFSKSNLDVLNAKALHQKQWHRI